MRAWHSSPNRPRGLPQLRFDDTFDDEEGSQQPQELPEYACA
jgi:hypothetical protein